MSSPEDDDAPFDLLADVDAETALLKTLARDILALGPGEEPTPEMIRAGLSALTRLYTVRCQKGEAFSPFLDGQSMPPTCVMVLATAMLKAVNLELFELGFWQAMSKG